MLSQREYPLYVVLLKAEFWGRPYSPDRLRCIGSRFTFPLSGFFHSSLWGLRHRNCVRQALFPPLGRLPLSRFGCPPQKFGPFLGRHLVPPGMTPSGAQHMASALREGLGSLIGLPEGGGRQTGVDPRSGFEAVTVLCPQFAQPETRPNRSLLRLAEAQPPLNKIGYLPTKAIRVELRDQLNGDSRPRRGGRHNAGGIEQGFVRCLLPEGLFLPSPSHAESLSPKTSASQRPFSVARRK